MKFIIKDFFRKCKRILRKLKIWSHLLKKFLTKTSFFVHCKMQEFVLIDTTVRKYFQCKCTGKFFKSLQDITCSGIKNIIGFVRVCESLLYNQEKCRKYNLKQFEGLNIYKELYFHDIP